MRHAVFHSTSNAERMNSMSPFSAYQQGRENSFYGYLVTFSKYVTYTGAKFRFRSKLETRENAVFTVHVTIDERSLRIFFLQDAAAEEPILLARSPTHKRGRKEKMGTL